MAKVAEFHCWVEKDEKGKYTGHFVKDGKEVQLYESSESVKRIASRLGKVGMTDLIKQSEHPDPTGVRFTADEPPAGPQPGC